MKFSTEKQNLSVPKDNSYGHLHNFESFQNIFSSKFCLVQFIRVKGIHVGIFWFQNKNSYTRNLASAIYLFISMLKSKVGSKVDRKQRRWRVLVQDTGEVKKGLLHCFPNRFGKKFVAISQMG